MPKQTDFRNALLCGLAVVFAVLLTNPISESPFNDDWSYSFTVKHLLETGQLTYNGWASASLVAQAYWGLLWVKVFGFSYTVLRLSTLPLAAMAISLVYLLGRRVGLQPRFAVFAALSVGLSPLYLPNATSFMTDAPGFFFTTFSLYLLSRAIDSPKTGPAIAWLFVGLIVGLVGGTARQIVWVAPLVVAPYAAWIRRDNLLFVFFALFGSALVLCGALLTLNWFAHQPYSIPEMPITSELKKAVHKPVHYVLSVLAIGFTILWMILPSLWGKTRGWTGTRAAVAFILLIGPVLLLVKLRPHYAMAPWMGEYGNSLSRQGVLGPSPLAGTRPDAMPKFVRAVSAITVYLVACCLVADLLIWLSRLFTAIRQTIRFFLFPDQGRALLPGMILFAAAYLVLLLPRAASDMVYDRYVVPLMPCVMFPLLLGCQKQEDRRIPAISWALFGIYAMYGIAITQDINALGRARAIAAARLTSAGIPRVNINGGFEFNYESQLEATGHINDSRIKVPTNGYIKGLSATFSFKPKYCLEFAPTSTTAKTPFGSVKYLSFLYPFHRTIYIDKYMPAATHPDVAASPGSSDDAGDK